MCAGAGTSWACKMYKLRAMQRYTFFFTWGQFYKDNEPRFCPKIKDKLRNKDNPRLVFSKKIFVYAKMKNTQMLKIFLVWSMIKISIFDLYFFILINLHFLTIWILLLDSIIVIFFFIIIYFFSTNLFNLLSEYW